MLVGLLFTVGLFWLLGMPGVTPVHAASFTVTKFTDSNDGACDADCSLREAIRAANTNADEDTIVLGAGTYVLSIAGIDNVAAFGDLDITKPLTITGQGAGITIIQQTAADRVLEVRHTTGNVVLQNMSITGGSSVAGAGLLATSGALFLEGVAVTQNNTPSNGGGMYVSNGQVTITGGQFLTNTASDQGGGIYVSQETARVWQSGGTLFSGNSALDFGGAIHIEEGRVELVDFQLVENTGYYGGAAMVYGADAYLTLSRGLVAYNHAIENGAGITTWNGQATLSQVGVVHNLADNIGGGLSNEYGTMYLTNVTVSDNTALVKTSVGGGGGGMYLGGSAIWSSKTTLIHSTVAHNSANIDAGGFSLESGRLTISNSIVAHNTGGNCTFHGNGEVISQGSNFEDTNLCGFDDPSDHPSTNPGLAALAAAGYHPLMGNSPAIDAAPCVPGVTVDQRGMPRPSGSACDSGAYEAAPTPVTGVSISGPTYGLYAQRLNFTANPLPVDASGPLVYTWTPAPLSGQGTSQVTYRWYALGLKAIAVSVTNAGGFAESTPHEVTIGGDFVFLPLAYR